MPNILRYSPEIKSSLSKLYSGFQYYDAHETILHLVRKIIHDNNILDMFGVYIYLFGNYSRKKEILLLFLICIFFIFLSKILSQKIE